MSVETVEPKADEKCALCDMVLAGVGLVISAVFLYFSVDVLSDGALTRALGLGTKREVEAE